MKPVQDGEERRKGKVGVVGSVRKKMVKGTTDGREAGLGKKAGRHTSTHKPALSLSLPCLLLLLTVTVACLHHCHCLPCLPVLSCPCLSVSKCPPLPAALLSCLSMHEL